MGRRRGVGGALAWCLFACLLGALVVAPHARALSPITRYVVASGNDVANDCTDSNNPCQTLQYAIDQANEGDMVDVAGTIADRVSIRKALTIEQWPGQDTAVLDGTNNGTVVTVDGTGTVTLPTVTISGLTIENGSSGGQGAGIVVEGGSTLTLENSTVTANNAFTNGGGIYNDSVLHVESSTISDNSAHAGSGIYSDTGATLTVENSTISGNTGSNGGGIYVSSGTASVVDSTLSGNSTDHGGGGVYVTGGTVLVAESTIDGNSATGSFGGGVYVTGGAVTIEASTIDGNNALNGNGGNLSRRLGGSVTLAADILANSSGDDCVTDSPITDRGYNIDDDGTCNLTATGSVSDSRAIGDYLESLADNTGPTETVGLRNLPQPSTATADPALAAVPPTFHLPSAVGGKTTACSVSDQRGIAPAAGIACDIGAYLLQKTTTTLAVSSTHATATGETVKYTATIHPAPDGNRVADAVGSVNFSDGSGSSGASSCAGLLFSGKATCTVSYTVAGSYTVTASYTGDLDNWTPSDSAGVHLSVAYLPGAPSAVTVVGGDGKAAVSWSAAAAHGSAVTGYTVTSSHGQTCTTSGLSCTVTGLTNGTSYTFTVEATNGIGAGPASSASSAVTPAGLPGAPSSVSAKAGDGKAMVSWKAAKAHGSAVSKYTVTASPGGRRCTTTGKLTCTVTGLTDGKSYRFTVKATNGAGTGAASAKSSAVTPAGLPGAPTHISAIAGDQRAKVSWSAAAARGSKVSGYTVVATTGNHTCSTKGALSCTVTGLVDGKTYFFNVEAKNGVGVGPPSRHSSAVTPLDTHAPTAPAALAGSFSNGLLVLTWRASRDNVAVDHYELYLNGVAIESVGRGVTSVTVRRYIRDGEGTYALHAVDAAGNESKAAGSVSVEPVARPASAPEKIPHWAWKLLAWQRGGKQGARPKTPKPLPSWYAGWKAWRLGMYRIVG